MRCALIDIPPCAVDPPTHKICSPKSDTIFLVVLLVSAVHFVSGFRHSRFSLSLLKAGPSAQRREVCSMQSRLVNAEPSGQCRAVWSMQSRLVNLPSTPPWSHCSRGTRDPQAEGGGDRRSGTAGGKESKSRPLTLSFATKTVARNWW